MKSNSKIIASLVTMTLSLSAWASPKKHHEHAHGKHVHGNGELTVAFNGAQALQIEFKVPAESIVGFEHKAKTEVEQKKLETALDALKKTMLQFIIPSEKAQCTASEVTTRIEYEDAGNDANKSDKNETKHGTHSEVFAQMSFSCLSPLSGQELKISPRAISKTLHVVDVTLLGEKSQSSAKVKKSGTTIKLP